MLIKFILLLSFSLPALAGAADLVGATDRDLKITIQELRGVQPRTKNNQYVKVTVFRGTKNFSLFCGRGGQLKDNSSEHYLDCSDYSESVSNDDDESLEFKIAMITNEKQETHFAGELSYSGDGTVYGEQIQILTGQDWSDNRMDQLRIDLLQTTNRDTPAFGRSQALAKSLKPLLGRKIEIRDGRVQIELPVERFAFRIDQDLKATVSAQLDSSEFQRIRISQPSPVEFSLLKTAGDLDSGFLSGTDVQNEVIHLLKVK